MKFRCFSRPLRVVGAATSQFPVFRRSQRVVRDQSHRMQMVEFCCQGSNFRHFRFRIIKARDHRRPESDLCPGLIQQAQILQDPVIDAAGSLPVQFPVHRFDIVKKQIRIRHHPRKMAPGHIAAGTAPGTVPPDYGTSGTGGSSLSETALSGFRDRRGRKTAGSRKDYRT